MQKPIILPGQSTTSPTYTLSLYSSSPTYTVSTSTTSPTYTALTTSPTFLSDNGSNPDAYIHKPLEPPLPSSYSSYTNNNNNNNNGNLCPYINTRFSKANVSVSVNNNKYPNRKKRSKTQQQIIYRPLPPSPSNSKHKKKRRSKSSAKHKNVAPNRYSHIRSDTEPIIFKPLPPTPPNAKKKKSSNNDKFIPMFSVNNNYIYDPPTKPNYKAVPITTTTNTSRGTNGHQSKHGHTKHNSYSLSTSFNISKHIPSSSINLAILSSTTANNEDFLNYCSKKSHYDVKKTDNDRKDKEDMVLVKKIVFDIISVQKDIYNYYFDKHVLLSSNGLTSGCYEWSIKIIKCEGSAQEMGIVSNPNIDKIKLKDGGLTQTAAFGARAVIGNQLVSDICSYYASYNADNTQRIYKDLSNKNKPSQNCWAKGDIITICLDLNKYHISFFLNNKKVRKKISVQPHKTYYPIISFVGDNQYDVTFTVC